MANVFTTFKHLFSRSQAWRLVASPIKEYIKGFSYFPGDLRDFIDNIWLDIFPDTTRELGKWENQFGIGQTGTTQERLDNLKGRWQAQGGQGFDYLQDLIHDSGYPQVFLHEWWFIDGSEVITINPNILNGVYEIYCLAPDSDCGATEAECGILLSTTDLVMLVNKGPELSSFDYGIYCLAPDSDCGSTDAECGVLTGLTFVPIEYMIPQDPVQWRYIIYVGAETFGEVAEVPAELRGEFERLLLGKMPYQQWMGLLINYV